MSFLRGPAAEDVEPAGTESVAPREVPAPDAGVNTAGVILASFHDPTKGCEI